MRSTPVPVNTRHNTFGYYEFLPNNYDASKKYPTILYFHGVGERGNGSATDLKKLLKNDIPKMLFGITANPFPEDCIVICPQAPDFSISVVSQIKNVLDQCIRVYNGLTKVIDEYSQEVTLPACDPNRIYVTGISAGGLGVWRAGRYFKNRVAAIIPISAAGNGSLSLADLKTEAEEMKYVPVWAMHAKNDPICNYTVSDNIINALKEAGSKVSKFLLYSDGGHGIWSRAYAEKGLWEWLFSQRLDQNIPPNQPPLLSLTSEAYRRYFVNAPISIEGIASDSDGKIQKVDIYVNKIFVYSTSEAVFKFGMTQTTPGIYNVEVIAYDDRGASVTVTKSYTVEEIPLPIVIKAVNNYKILFENEKRPIVKTNGVVAIFDKKDKIGVYASLPKAGKYFIKARVRTGFKQGTLDRSTWNSKSYNLDVNGTLTPYNLDITSLSSAQSLLGGSYWGNLVTDSVELNQGSNIIGIESKAEWLAVDQIELMEDVR